MLAGDDLFETPDRVLELHVFSRQTGEFFADMERLGEKFLDLTCTRNRQLVLVGKFIHAQDADDVLQILVCLEDLFDPLRHRIMLLPHDTRLEYAGSGIERVDRRIDAELHDLPAEHRCRVQVREHRRRGGVCKVVGRDVDCLDRCDGPFLCRRDPFLQLTHFRAERRLVTDGRRHAAEEGGHFGARLDKPEDIVDKQEDVAPFLVAEIFRDRQRGKTHACTGTRGLVHLSEHECGLVDNPCPFHFAPEVVPFARPLTHPGEDRESAVLLRNVVYQLLYDDRLADSRPAEETRFPPLGIRLQQIDDLDAGFEHLFLCGKLIKRRRRPMDRVPLFGLDLSQPVDPLTDDVDQPAQRRGSHRDGNRVVRVEALHSPDEPVRRIHRDSAHPVVTQVLLDLDDQILLFSLGVRAGDPDGIEYFGE